MSIGSAPPGFQGVDISVIVPVYRNRDTLRALCNRLHLVLEGLTTRYEIIFVNDACPEGSGTVLEELAEDWAGVEVLTLSRNRGQHRAVMEGLSRARGCRVVTLDADLQDPPEAIPFLLEKMDQGLSAAFAGRQGRYESRTRLCTSRLFKGLLHLLCGLPSDAGMFVAMDRRMVEYLLSCYAPCPFVVGMIGCSRLPTASIPVMRACREKGRSAYSGWKRLSTGCRAILWVFIWKLGLDGKIRLFSRSEGSTSTERETQ